MHTLEIVGYKKVNFASRITELTKDEFIYMMLLLYQQQNNELSIDQFRFLLTAKLLKLKKTVKFYNLKDADREILNDNLNRVVETIDSFYSYTEEDNKLVKKLDLFFIKNMLPDYGGLYGPDDALTNCTIFEYKEALSNYNEYMNTSNEDSLNKLIAILYREQHLYKLSELFATGKVSKRQPFLHSFKRESLNHRASKVAKWPPHVKLAILLWFGNCVEYVVTGKPTIDGIEIDFSKLFSSKNSESSNKGIGMTGIIYSLSESGVFGNAEATSNTNLYDVLMRLYQLKCDHDEMLQKK